MKTRYEGNPQQPSCSCSQDLQINDRDGWNTHSGSRCRVTQMSKLRVLPNQSRTQDKTKLRSQMSLLQRQTSPQPEVRFNSGILWDGWSPMGWFSFAEAFEHGSHHGSDAQKNVDSTRLL